MRVYWINDGIQFEVEDDTERQALKTLFHAAKKTDLRAALLDRIDKVEKSIKLRADTEAHLKSISRRCYL